MTPEAWTVLVVGIGLAGLVFRMDAHVRSRANGSRASKARSTPWRNPSTP